MNDLFLHLRCIVVKATQVLESSLVAELVFILGERHTGQRQSDKNELLL